MVADFVATPAPHLNNLRSYAPGGPAYYETGSFSSDSRSLFYTSDQDTHSFWQSQIYRLDLATGRSTRLPQGHTYNEHPAVNVGRPNNPENDGRTLVAGKVTANPAGNTLLGDVQDSLVRQTGFVDRIRLTCRPAH
ncbi:MAG: hypothetical protein ACREVO_13680 [Steroidobacteraceae bacterium]